MTSPQNDQEPPAPPEPLEVLHPSDSFRRIYFGQISDPLIPEPDEASATPDDELTRAALADPDAYRGEEIDPRPTSWRWVFLLLVAVVALGIVFRGSFRS